MCLKLAREGLRDQLHAGVQGTPANVGVSETPNVGKKGKKSRSNQRKWFRAGCLGGNRDGGRRVMERRVKG